MSWDNFFALLLFGIPILLVLYGMFDWFSGIKDLVALKNRNSREKELLKNGIKTDAIVKDIIQTGVFVNENPEVDLIVNSSDGADLTIRTVVNLVMIPRLQPGCKVIIFVDPENSMHAALEQ